MQTAIRQRKPPPGLIDHSDQGQQYSGAVYRSMLKANGIVQSMSRRGNCLGNAVAESFFSNLKNELVRHTVFEDRAEAPGAIFDYMELFYNSQCIQQTPGFKAPADYEAQAIVA